MNLFQLSKMTLRTDVEDLSRSNKPPSDSQITYCRARLQEKNAAIAELNAKRAGLQWQITMEEVVRQSYLRILSPFRRIPDDVLREIFLACVPDDLVACAPHKEEAPLLLRRVCSHWRTIAMDTAALWTKIVIQDRKDRPWRREGAFDDKQTRQMVEKRIQEWTKLSKHMPLQVCLGLGEEGASFVVQEWLGGILRPLAPRIYHLTLQGEDANKLLEESLFSELGMFPELRSVIVEDSRWLYDSWEADADSDSEDSDHEETPSFVTTTTIFPGSTKLHSADVTLFPSPRLPVLLPQQSIARLHLRDPRNIKCITTLERYSNLRYLRLINVKVDSRGRPGSRPRPTIPSVEALSIVYEDASKLPIQRIGILEDVEFPSLKALHLSSLALNPWTKNADVFWYTHPRTVSALSKLTAFKLDRPMGRVSRHLLKLLKLTPKLRKLHVTLRENWDDIHDFASAFESLDIVPDLEELELEITKIDRDVIKGMIASRRERTDKFRQLVVFGSIVKTGLDMYPAVPGVEIRQENLASRPCNSFWNEWTHGLCHPRKSADEEWWDHSDDDPDLREESERTESESESESDSW